MVQNKIISLVLFSIIFCSTSIAQSFRCFVVFTDKQNNSFSLDQPEKYLSSRAILRRANQRISITESDLPLSEVYVQSIASLPGTRVVAKSKWLNGLMLEVSDTLLWPILSSFPFVKSIQILSGGNTRVNNKWNDECSVENKWQIKVEEMYGTAFNQIALHQGSYLHRVGYRAKDLVIAVLDAGFPEIDQLEVFARLRSENRILGRYDFVSMDADISDQLHPHGTVVLSCMAADLPGTMVGTAPDASYWLFVTEDVSQEALIEEYNWVIAAEYADSVGADIINSSLGYTTFDDTLTNHTYADLNGNTTIITIGADLAASKGILVVNSAGNSGTSPWFHIGAPADGDSVLAVGAIDANGNYAAFSSKGPSSDGRVKPNVAAKGLGAAVVWTDGTIINGNGTSFSSPIMAGLAACLWQAFPNKNNMDIINALQNSASQFNQPDSLMGYGIPDLFKAYQDLGGIFNADVFQTQLIAVYPNPFTSEINITYYANGDSEIEIELTDINGKRFYKSIHSLFDGQVNYIRCNDLTQDLSPGVYLIKLTTSTNKVVKKMIRY